MFLLRVRGRQFSTKVDVKGPLNGIRVLDLTRILAGPYCTQLLGDAGAEVIKIELPNVGDDTRTWGPPFVGSTKESTYFLSINRNKLSITVDLKKQRGVELIKRLARKCDVVVENFKPGGAKSLGIDYDDLRRVNPELIYASITGFGRSGPDRDRLAYDVFVSAASGLMSITGSKQSGPMKIGVAMTDLMTGTLMFGAINAALLHRFRYTEGQRIDTSLFETQLASLANVGSAYLLANAQAQRWSTAHPSIVPYQAFTTASRYVTVGALNDSQYRRLVDTLKTVVEPSACNDEVLAALTFLQSDSLRTNPQRVAERNKLIASLQLILNIKSAEEWQTLFDSHQVPCCPINSVEEAFNLAQTVATEMVQTIEHPTIGAMRVAGLPLKFSLTRCSLDRPPPLLGEHTNSVLRDIIGLSEQEIESLRNEKVI